MIVELDNDRVTLFRGDCREVLASFDDAVIDAVVTDPPYELGFMGKAWDRAGVAFDPATWAAILRVLKPGGHLLAFGGTRTYHRMTCAIEDAGFEIRDSVLWMYGTGFPKSLNLGDGRGTALKPAHEPIVMARKPLVGTVAANVAAHGTGALNIDACRIDGAPRTTHARGNVKGSNAGQVHNYGLGEGYESAAPAGRWPANVILDEHAAAMLDAQSGTLKAGVAGRRGGKGGVVMETGFAAYDESWGGYGDAGGASRFFYVAKPSRKERDLGCEHLPEKTGGEATDREDGSAGTQNPRAGAGRTGGARNFHPTVKPIELMRYLVRLVTPPGGVVLDPFAGSGTTGIAALREGARFVGVERSEEYTPITVARLQHAHEAHADD